MKTLRILLSIIPALVLPGQLAAEAVGEPAPPPSIAILPNDGPGADPSEPMRVVWSTEPGVRHMLQESTSLASESWATVSGYPSEATGLAGQHTFERDPGGRGFFRVAELDEQGPQIVGLNPADGAYGIGRFRRIEIELSDRTGIDPDSIELSIGGAPAMTLDHPGLSLESRMLVYTPEAGSPLGGRGELIGVSMSLADPLGNPATYAWAFELEKDLVEATDLFLFGSLAARSAGQHIADSATGAFTLSHAGFDGPVAMGGDVPEWELAEVGEDYVLISYSGDNPPAFAVGQPIANLIPRTVGEIFHRLVTDVTDDPVAKLLTLHTEEADFWRILAGGSFGIGDEIVVFDVDEEGRILNGEALSTGNGTVELPAIAIDWSNRAIMGTYTTGGGETEIVWGTDLESPPGGGQWTSKLTLDAMNILVSPVFSFEADLDVPRFHCETSMRINPQVSASFEFFEQTGAVESRSTLWHARKAIWIPNTPLWIILDLRMDLAAGFDGSVTGRISTDTRAEAPLGLVIDYDASRAQRLIYDPRVGRPAVDLARPPALEAGGTLAAHLTLVPVVRVDLNSLAAIEISVDSTVGLDGTASWNGSDPGTADVMVLGEGHLNAAVLVGRKTGDWLPSLDPVLLYSSGRKWVLPEPGPEEPLVFLVGPSNLMVPIGGTIALDAQVNRGSGVIYEWFKDGVTQGVFTGNRFIRSNAKAADSGVHHVVARRGRESISSNTANVLVVPAGYRPPKGFARIPAGWFVMGRTSGDNAAYDSNAPPVNVYVSEFYMARDVVTKEQWDEVRTWGLQNGYTDLSVGEGKAADHPVHSIVWFMMVKWCNARSEMEGLTPCYTAGGSVLRSGGGTPVCDWPANGYRLPTEAEWEKAGRGGFTGLRYPWGDSITHSHANYYSKASISYDISPTRGLHPTYHTGLPPYTAPVGSFAPNGFGLHNMVGNTYEACWDWYSPNTYTDGAIDPKGAPTGTRRIVRSSHYSVDAVGSRLSYRSAMELTHSADGIGFRVARSKVP